MLLTEADGLREYPLEEAAHCTQSSDSAQQCELVARQRGIGTLALVRATDSSPLEVLEANAAIMRSHYPIAWRPDGIRVAALIAILMLLLIPFVHRWQAVSEWTLVAGATVCLAFISPIALSVLGAEILVAWWAVHTPRTEIGRRRIIVALVASSVTILFSAKLFQQHSLDIPFGPLGLPLGLSFFTIRLVDTLLAWRARLDPSTSFREFACFLLFPSTLVAGPVDTLVRFRASRLPTLSISEHTRGLQRALFGVAKKVVLADYLLAPKLAVLLDQVLSNTSFVPWSTVAACLTLAFFYAYADFSGYADIAIGAGRMLGRGIPENFREPVIATSPRDFWRRWHISVSQWAFRNVFFPLAVVMKSSTGPMFGVMLTIGLWHALAFSWVAWAIHHATGLAIEARLRIVTRPLNTQIEWMLRPVRIIATIAFVSAGHSFVLISHTPTALLVYARFLTFGLFH